MEARLRKLLPADVALTIDVDGVPGDRIIGGNYLPRLRARLGMKIDSRDHGSLRTITRVTSNGRPTQDDAASRSSAGALSSYDWIILQAGGNDLGNGSDPQEVFDQMQKVYAFIFSANEYSTSNKSPKTPNILSLTVTETSSPSTFVRDRYHALNDMIRRHTEPGYFVADVCKAVPYHDMDLSMRRRVWDDGLHFRSKGYDMFGEFVGERLASILNSEINKKGQGDEGEKLLHAKI